MFKNIRVKGYKVFSEDNEVSICDIQNVNVIIGKNNCGKSSMLDVIEMACDAQFFSKKLNEIQDIYVDIPISREAVSAVFKGYSSIGGLGTEKSYWESMKDKDIKIKIVPHYSYNHTWEIKGILNEESNVIGYKDNRWQQGLKTLLSGTEKLCFRRLSAERNILPEIELDEELSSTGEGASNIVRKFLNDSTYDESIIETQLLSALNTIIYPEAEFENIRIQQIAVGDKKMAWEIFLQEKGCSRVPLSKTGSGIKTIILMLLNLIVIPKTKQYENREIIFGFEELENNLHPAIQRRLFEYLYDFAIKNNKYIFITTHSHVAINTFYDKENACIYHVIKRGNCANVKKIDSYMDKAEILDDLDVKASDILQSNGIVWVEGPSDRVYIKKWLEVFTDNKYEEGKHYQFLYYGGRLLKHYSTEEVDGLISFLTTNRNAAIVIDSDKRNKNAIISTTKQRIVEEFQQLNMFAWVTKGKEIENYLSKIAISLFVKKEIKRQCAQYQLFPDFIKKYYNSFESKKVSFANEVKDYITKENSSNILDLKKQIQELYNKIESWNL